MKAFTATAAFVRSWKQRFLMQMVTLLVLTGSLTLVTFAVNLCFNFERVLAVWSQNIQITVYLKDDLQFKQVSQVGQDLKNMGIFKSVVFVSQHDALKTFTSQMATYAPDLLKEGDFADAFPASFVATVSAKSEALVHDGWLAAQAQKIKAISGVDQVSYGQGWIKNYSSFVHGLRAMGFTLVGVLLLGALLVIGNAIRASIMQHREEVEILELFGATSSMIRAPYLSGGAFLGAAAAVISLAVNYGIYRVQINLFHSSWSFMGLASHLRFLTPIQSILFVLLSAGLGLLGAYTTIRDLNTGWSASQRLTVS